MAIIGLGRFGISLAKELGPSATQVIAIDRSTNLINDVKEYVDLAVKLDSTDQSALISQGIDKVDVIVVAIGENFEAALLTTVIAKKMGIPEIICRAQTRYHAEIFLQIGATKVIQPEKESGIHLAHQLANPHLNDFLTLAEGFSLVELAAPAQFVGQSLLSLNLRKEYEVNLIFIKRPIPVETPEGEPPKLPQVKGVFPKPSELIEENDILVLVGSNISLAKLPK